MNPISDASTATPSVLDSSFPLAQSYEGKCPVRDVLDRLGDAWSVLAIMQLQLHKQRFNELRRNIPGISQRMLTVTLRHLERDGLVNRHVYPTTPPQVEYELTELGYSLAVPIHALSNWAFENQARINQARETYDQRTRL